MATTRITESSGRAGPGPVETGLGWEPVKAFAVFVVIQIAMVTGGVTPILDGMLVDPDAYMRLNRVVHLWDGGAWFDPVYPRIGPPDGHIQHWTRPMDLLLLVGAAFAAPFVGFETGLHWWGVIIAPAMQLPALVALVWAAAPLIRRDRLWLVGLLFAIQPGTLLTFLVGRPDQNCLLVLLFALTIGMMVRLLLRPDRLRLAALNGVVAAIALWVSVETMVFVVAAIAVPGLYWLLGDRRLARALLVHAGALFAMLLVALLLERGFVRFAVVEFDMISIAHLQLLGLNLLFWAAAVFVPERWRLAGDLPGRAGVAVLSALAVLGVLWVVQPGFFQSPFANVDDLYRNLRLVNIEEFQPVVRWSALGWAELPAAIGDVLLWLGVAVVAGPCLIWMIRTRPDAERRGWVLLAGMTAIFVPLALLQIRWVAYAETLLVIPYAAAIGPGLAWLGRQQIPEPWLAVPRALAVSLACIWTFAPATIAGAIASDTGPDADPIEVSGICPPVSLSRFLADPEGLGNRPRRVLAFVDLGPELLYRTPHSVFSIPNHRFQPGFTATHRIMTSRSIGEAQRLIREAGVEVIVICPAWPVEAQFYGLEPGGSDRFYGLLGSGITPSFLDVVPLPEDLGRHFRIFAVKAI